MATASAGSMESNGGPAKMQAMPTGLTLTRPSQYNDVTLKPGGPVATTTAATTSPTRTSGGYDISQSVGAGSSANRGSEPMLGISAQDLMSDGCSHCGWIRKLGGNVHNCKLNLAITANLKIARALQYLEFLKLCFLHWSSLKKIHTKCMYKPLWS